MSAKVENFGPGVTLPRYLRKYVRFPYLRYPISNQQWKDALEEAFGLVTTTEDP
jgi:hypothetical protein